MLQSTSSRHQRRWLTTLLLLSLAPVSILITLLNALQALVQRVRDTNIRKSFRSYLEARRGSSLERGRILLSGGSSQCLAIARQLRASSHNVIVTDFERIPFLHLTRYSVAVSNFIPIPRSSGEKSYFNAVVEGIAKMAALFGIRIDLGSSEEAINYPEHILETVLRYSIDTWIPCHSVLDRDLISKTRELLISHSNCLVIYPSIETLKLAEDMSIFARYVDLLNSSIRMPGAMEVSSRGEIHRQLGGGSNGWRFVLKMPSGNHRNSHDSTGIPSKESWWRGSGDSGFFEATSSEFESYDERESTADEEDLVPIPLDSVDETYEFLARMSISEDNPGVLFHVVHGLWYMASSLVVDNEIRTFAAFSSPSSVSSSRLTTRMDQLSHDNFYGRLLHPSSSLYHALAEFMQKFVSHLPGKTSGYVNLHFILSDSMLPLGAAQRFWAVGCNFEPPLSPTALISGAADERPCEVRVVNHRELSGTYSFPPSVYHLAFLPILDFSLLRCSGLEVLGNLSSFMDLIVHGHEEFFSWMDPGPWLWKWLVGAPVDMSTKLIALSRVKGRRAAQSMCR